MFRVNVHAAPVDNDKIEVAAPAKGLYTDEAVQ